jgi:hypothetical protein
MRSHITAIGKKWRESKVRPIPGNSPHDRPVSRGISFSFWRICDDPFPPLPFCNCNQPYWGAQYAFLRHGGIYLVRCGFKVKTKPRGGTVPPPDGRPRAQVKERVGRTTLHLIVRR